MTADQVVILTSLVDLREIILDCLDTCGVHSVVEIGAETGAFTAVLGEWADARSGRVWSVEPSPSELLLDTVGRFPTVELVTEFSLDFLEHSALADAYILDGDHNYHTVSGELARLSAQAPAPHDPPLIVVHDIGWPWGRRDSYYDPARLAPEAVREHTFVGGIAPGDHGIVDHGILHAGAWAAAVAEGGARNGVQTAVDDFLATDARYGYIAIPVVFGLGLLYPKAAPYAADLEARLKPMHNHPVLARIEANRIELILQAQAYQRAAERNQHIANDHARIAGALEAMSAERAALEARVAETEAAIEALVESRSWRLTAGLRRLRRRLPS